MIACPKHPRIEDKKYRASFGKFHEHQCLLTGAEFTEYGSETIDGAHITIGRYGHSMKPSDNLILPLRHSLHMLFDKNQEQFINLHFYEFGMLRILEAEAVAGSGDKVKIVKEIARQYYQNWKSKQ